MKIMKKQIETGKHSLESLLFLPRSLPDWLLFWDLEAVLSLFELELFLTPLDDFANACSLSLISTLLS
jgi:hypothetical protein